MASSSSTPEASGAPAPCRVALCDDAHEYVRLLELVFGAEPDVEVVGTASNGATAIELCREVQPDVLFLDVAMPVLDGIAALPQIVEASSATRVVVLTGFASPEVERRAVEAGAAQVLLKGTDPMQLVSTVRSHHAELLGA